MNTGIHEHPYVIFSSIWFVMTCEYDIARKSFLLFRRKDNGQVFVRHKIRLQNMHVRGAIEAGFPDIGLPKYRC